MALTAKILNPEASLNFWLVLNSIDLIPGTQVDVVLRLFNPDMQDRYVPPATTIMTVEFMKADGTTLTKTLSLNADDRSIASVTLEEADTADLIGGNLLFTLDLLGDGSKLMKGVISNGLRIIDTEC